MADGRKMNPFLISERKTLPANVKFPENVIVQMHPKRWMETDLLIDWIDAVRRKGGGADLRVLSMLVLDLFRCHISQRVKDKLATCFPNTGDRPRRDDVSTAATGRVLKQTNEGLCACSVRVAHCIRAHTDASRKFEESNARRPGAMGTRRLESIPAGDGRTFLSKVRPFQRH